MVIPFENLYVFIKQKSMRREGVDTGLVFCDNHGLLWKFYQFHWFVV